MKRLPPFALLLTLLGLLPIFCLTLLILFFGTVGSAASLKLALLSYCSVIMAFTGAIHWGLALERPLIIVGDDTPNSQNARFIMGIVPALAAWCVLLSGILWNVSAGLLSEALALLGVLAMERRAYRRGALPEGWYPLLVLTTLLSVTCLIFAALS